MAAELNGKGEKREIHGVDKQGTTVHSEHILSAVPTFEVGDLVLDKEKRP